MRTLRLLALRGRTARLRFTVLYTAVFLGSAVALLAFTNLWVGANESRPAPDQGPAATGSGLAETQLTEIQAMQSRQLLVGSLVALAVMVVVSVLLGNAIAGRVLRPLRTITAATNRISAENLNERLAVPGPADEVKDLADTIDGLLGRLEASFAAQRRFVANASHELRTPLATMRASVEVALAKPEPAPPQTVALAGRLSAELDRVDQLLEGLLELARAQHGALADSTPVSLGELASLALVARGADIAAKGLTVDDGDLERAAWTRGSRTLLTRMVDNVVDNAVVHNRDGGRIRVAAAVDGTAVRLTVQTGGPVLDPEHVARLGRPFQRLATERTGSGTGTGLGLSIVAAVVDAHGGRLDLHAVPAGGLRVTIALPRTAGPGNGGTA